MRVEDWMCLRKEPWGPSNLPRRKEMWEGRGSNPSVIFSDRVDLVVGVVVRDGGGLRKRKWPVS